MVFDHRGGEGVTQNQILIQTSFYSDKWPFSVQILKILSKKAIVKVRGGGGQRSMVKDHTFALFKFWDPSLNQG